MSVLPSGMGNSDGLGPKEVTWAHPSPRKLRKGWVQLSVPPHTRELGCGICFPWLCLIPFWVWAAGKPSFWSDQGSCMKFLHPHSYSQRNRVEAALVSPRGLRTSCSLPIWTRGRCQGIRAMKASFLPQFEEEKKMRGLGMWRAQAQTTPTAHPSKEAFPAFAVIPCGTTRTDRCCTGKSCPEKILQIPRRERNHCFLLPHLSDLGSLLLAGWVLRWREWSKATPSTPPKVTCSLSLQMSQGIDQSAGKISHCCSC